MGAKEKDAKEKIRSRNGGIAENSAPGLTAQGTKDWSIHIVGSDLLPSSIEVAERGLYPQSALTGLPPASIRACFSKIGSPNGQNGSQDGRKTEQRTAPATGQGMVRRTARTCW